MLRNDPPRVGGVILCGGESARMGRPKAWLDIAGEPLLARMVRILRTVTHPVVVVAAAEQSLPPLGSDIQISRDVLPGRGPLQGMAAGFAALDRTVKPRCDAVYVSACDVPWLRPQFVQRMIDLLEDFDAAMPMIDGQPFPLSGVYRVSVRAVVDQMLAEDRRSPRLLLERTRCRSVRGEELREVDPDLVSLRDVTTPGDYERARGAPILNFEL